MSGAFKGFTDKDIEKIKNTNKDTGKTGLKSIMKKKTLVLQQNEKMYTEPIDDKAKLSKSSSELNDNSVIVNVISKNACEEVNLENDETNNNFNGDSLEKNDMIVEEFKEIPCLSIEKPINMQEFQLQQKLIEEQNRIRREMLSKALEDREKQTADEAIRLEKIKKELQTLDAQLSDDVSILRKQIDKSCLSYTEAEKNYHKVEKEFLTAKLHLQKEKERKELLTEHLCTLIAHNEARKAKKLESLMDQLVYSKIDSTHTMSVIDGVCEQTGKMVEIENEEVLEKDG